MVDSNQRFDYGRQVLMVMDIPTDTEFGKLTPWRKELLFCFPTHGYPHDVDLAKKHLVPGRVYQAIAIEVHASMSWVTLADFPDQRFNTVMFSDWPTVVA